jgi:NifU-like protein involved in Fe-S cluster formation
MDEAVIKYYRRLLRSEFEHAGTIENPDIYLDTVAENVQICGHMGDYLHLYIKVLQNKITDIRYLCICDPTANVAIELLCALVMNKTFEEINKIDVNTFSETLASDGKDFQKRATGLLELLHRGITNYLK